MNAKLDIDTSRTRWPNKEHLEFLNKGVEFWNQWRKENPDIRPDLSRAHLGRRVLRGADLRFARLSNAYFGETDLREAYLYRANLSGADLSGANLSGATLFRADLKGANLSMTDLSEVNFNQANLDFAKLNRANLSKADLSVANLSNCVLEETIFNEAKMSLTNFGDVDLSTAKGLDTVIHQGYSIIGIGTFYRSSGNIPKVFLRGVGLPDTFITYISSLTEQPIQYYSCFISYSSQDETFAQRLHADLQQKGVRCWFAPEDMKIGDKIRPTIDQSIRIHDKLLLILSENSLNSFWVESEVEKAFEEERQRNTTMLFPVRLNEAVMETNQPWVAEIRRTRHIGDFTRWKEHDAYQQAFERLLHDLKTEE